jgi:hypothetical protein
MPKIFIYNRQSSDQIKDPHADAERRDEGTESVSDDGCAADDSSESGLVIFDEGGPGRPDVGGGADEEQHHDNHAIEAEEGALSRGGLTILHLVVIYSIIIIISLS